MKKLLLTVTILALVAFTSTSAFASATLKTKVKVTPDTLINNTVPGSFSGDKISLELAYMTAVGVREDGANVIVSFHLGGFTGRYCPALVASEVGKFGTVAYNSINGSYNSWSRNNSSNVDAITFSDSGAVVNSKYFSTKKGWSHITISASQSACGTSGLYPAYKFIVEATMPKSVYDDQVKDALGSWAGSSLVVHASGTTQ